MMIKPGISELSRCVDSRYTLVTMAAKRARMIGKTEVPDPNVKRVECPKPVSKAVSEIAEGKVSYVRRSLSTNDEMSWQTELIEVEEPVFVRDDEEA